MERRRRGRESKKAERRDPIRTNARLEARVETEVTEVQLTERERLTVQLPRGLIERLRNAVYWTPGLTVTAFFQNCISSVVDQLETERGNSFPQRERALRPGRPKSRLE